MSGTAADEFLTMVAGRKGHFLLESGHHGELWLDLDALFAEPRRVAPMVARLTDALRPHGATVVCGPLVGGAFLAQAVAAALDVEFAFTERLLPAVADGLYPALYRLPPAFAQRVRGRRIAIVDDVMSAGSAARGTYTELRAHEGVPAVAGALLVLGSTGADFFTRQGVAVEAVARRPYRMWLPEACPLCDSGAPLEAVSRPEPMPTTTAGDG
jgi:orotate phosphoribosyltransferase